MYSNFSKNIKIDKYLTRNYYRNNLNSNGNKITLINVEYFNIGNTTVLNIHSSICYYFVFQASQYKLSAILSLVKRY